MSIRVPAEISLNPATLDFLSSGPKKLFIGGEWLPASKGETFDSYNPATGELLARVSLADGEDVAHAVQAARAAFERGPWSQMTGEAARQPALEAGGLDRPARR